MDISMAIGEGSGSETGPAEETHVSGSLIDVGDSPLVSAFV